MKNKKNIIISVIILLLIIFLILDPPKYIIAAEKGLILWGKIIFPSLLPFFFLTKLITELGAMQSLTRIFAKPMYKLYRSPGISGYIFFMSILSGYPMGAKLISDYYEKKLITKEEVVRMSSFCSTSGPMFIVGSVGVGLFLSKTAGFIMLSAHILGALLNGLIFRFYKGKSISKMDNIKEEPKLLSDSMYNSIMAVLIICGFICTSFVIIEFINTYNLLYPLEKFLNLFFHNAGLSRSIVNGILEVTKGCVDISVSFVAPKIFIPIVTGLVSFGGISIHMQSFVFLSKSKMKYSMFLLQKTTHCLLSVGLSLLFCLFI